MLVLPIKKKWFDLILHRIKKEEYREIKPYYTKRFQNAGLLDADGMTTNQEVDIALRNGYSANDPMLHVRVVMKRGYGVEEWGAESGVEYYCLEIVRVYKLTVNGQILWQSSRPYRLCGEMDRAERAAKILRGKRKRALGALEDQNRVTKDGLVMLRDDEALTLSKWLKELLKEREVRDGERWE